MEHPPSLPPCIDFLLDGYHKAEQVTSILNEGLQRNSPEGLRDRTTAALSHYGILSGEDARGIQLPDIQHLPMNHREGPTVCDIMVILLMEGKSNQEGKTQYCGAMRNKDWEACPLGAMAMWLFYRHAHFKATKALLKKVGISQHSKKVTHIFRGSAARDGGLARCQRD